ncbi:MAG: HAMP domain-containing protein [Hyphomicrobiales bacterium]|nr:HAMP domain-containing protein [Hyphomicrobiales bacterium]MCP5372324.1 HAMP domain-containing protein [Hyphomicrobiales bacterium]
MIIVTPLVLLQVVSAFIFYESHWGKISFRLARGLAGDIALVAAYLREHPGPEGLAWIRNRAAIHMEVAVDFRPGEVLPNEPSAAGGGVDDVLVEALHTYLGKPFQVTTPPDKRTVMIAVQLADGVLHTTTTRKRLFSSTTYVFVIWMVGTSLILFGVATIFMRNQVRPIRRLALAADAFGKGRDAPAFKPEGAAEVRQAAAAFLAMRERIGRQITQRTEMLAGVSHDLRTPLTRMKLQLALLRGQEGLEDLKTDIVEMERMLEAYLAFARGEGAERATEVSVDDLLGEVVDGARRNGGQVDFRSGGDIVMPLRPNAFKRSVTNLIENATRYGGHVAVNTERQPGQVRITIDDDGPGIPEDRREEVFRPFFRLEDSRNPVTGGVGLGLSIARDVIRSHGGDIELGDSPLGGLRAAIVLPL